MTEGKSFDIIKLAIQLVVGLLGALLGSGIAWGVTQQKLTDFDRRLSVQEARADALNNQVNTDRVYMAGQLGEIKAKLDTALNRQ